MKCLPFLFVLFFHNVLAQTDASPSTPPSQTTTPAPGLFTLQFIIGLSVTGGVALMVILFMSITACQRAYKNRPKKPVTIKKEPAKEPVKIENAVEIVVSK